MRERTAMYNANALKIGLFGANCSSGRSATKGAGEVGNRSAGVNAHFHRACADRDRIGSTQLRLMSTSVPQPHRPLKGCPGSDFPTIRSSVWWWAQHRIADLVEAVTHQIGNLAKYI
jgi:hypothetical protein